MARAKGKMSPVAAGREPRTLEAAQTAYENRKQQVWDKGKEKLDKALKASKGHSPARLGELGEYSRSGDYRAYGLVYIKKHSRNAVYNLPAEVLGRRLAAIGRGSRDVASGSAEHGARYRLDYQRPCRGGAQQNFLWGFLPYENQAHHVIPKEAFDLAFDHEQKRILAAVPYDLNHGENIILLPKKKRERFIHRLVNHSGCHPTYSDLVVGDMKAIRAQLEKCSCDKPSPPLVSVLRQLIELQGDYWKYIVEWSKANCSQTINEAAAAEIALRKTRAKSGI